MTDEDQCHSGGPGENVLPPLVRQNGRLALGQPQPHHLDGGRVQHWHHRGQSPCLKPLFRAVLGSTYGRGSRKTSAPAYGYGSRPYGAGTGRASVHANGWGTLGSSRAGEEERAVPRGYGAKESYLLTTINADRDGKTKRGSVGPEEGESTGKNSVESLTRGTASRGLGGIKVDTEVNVVESHSPVGFSFEEEDRRERKDMI